PIRRSATMVLETGRAEPGEATLVDRPLPGQDLVHGQLVAITSLLDADKTSAHGRHDLRLAADDPAFRVPRREIGNRQRTPIGANDVAHTRSHLMFGHDTQYCY